MSEATPPFVKRQRLNFGESIRLLIGAEKQEVLVPKAILTKSSEFFKACCDGHNWKESVTKTVELPEDDLETFSAYLQFLFTGELVVTEEVPTRTMRHGDEEKREELSWANYAALWELAVLADRLNDITLSNAVVDSTIAVSIALHMCPGSERITDLYPRVPQSAPIRLMLRDMYASSKMGDDLEEDLDELPADFVRELAAQLLRAQRQKKESVAYKDRCKYHIHNDKVPKCT